MPYSKCRVYNDGSHWVAIDPVFKPVKREGKPFREEEKIEIEGRLMTKGEYFDELYDGNRDMRRPELMKLLREKISPLFEYEDYAQEFIEHHMKRRNRNMSARLRRLYRKINMQKFNYFCTFTYADDKQTEESFKRRLTYCLANFVRRRDWTYIGVWERGAKTDRLHFHGMFDIPEGQMVGELFKKKDYSRRKHKTIETTQNTYFNKRFGRSDFDEINNTAEYMECVGYISKYLRKSGEKIVYSKGTYQYLITDVMDDDVVCANAKARKLILFDNFACWEDGCFVGEISDEVIAQMPKSN